VPRTPLLRPGKIILGGLLWGGLYFVIGLYFTQDIRDGIDASGFATSAWRRVPSGITLLWMFSYVGAFITSIVLVFKRSFFNAICLIGVVCSSQLYAYALRAIRGDRYDLTDGSHREIADIYRQRHADFVTPGPHLVPLENQCHPPNSCTCWVVWDPSYTSELEKDLGRWHEPTSSIFMFLPGHLPYKVDVRRIELHAYSVLACVDPGPGL
jgi:hypothetical protein